MIDADVADASILTATPGAVPTQICPNQVSAGPLCVSAGACADTILLLTLSM